MNSKYFLLMILTICKIESHTFFKDVARTIGIGIVHLQKKSIHSFVPHRAPELHPAEYQKVTEAEQSSIEIKQPSPVVPISEPKEPIQTAQPSKISPEEHALIITIHPNFYKNYTNFLNDTAENIERKLKWCWYIVEHKTKQLEHAHAEIFEKVTNDRGEDIKTLIAKFKQEGRPTDNLISLFRLIEGRFRSEPVPL